MLLLKAGKGFHARGRPQLVLRLCPTYYKRSQNGEDSTQNSRIAAKKEPLRQFYFTTGALKWKKDQIDELLVTVTS